MERGWETLCGHQTRWIGLLSRSVSWLTDIAQLQNCLTICFSEHILSLSNTWLYILNRIQHVYIKTDAPIFTVALFIIPKEWKPPKVSINWKMNKIWHDQTMGYYSAMEKSEVLTRAATEINPYNMPSEGPEKQYSGEGANLAHSWPRFTPQHSIQ